MRYILRMQCMRTAILKYYYVLAKDVKKTQNFINEYNNVLEDENMHEEAKMDFILPSIQENIQEMLKKEIEDIKQITKITGFSIYNGVVERTFIKGKKFIGTFHHY